MSDYVFGWYWHQDLYPQGRLFHPEDGETIESLTARGYVDDPCKIGKNPWGPAAQGRVEQVSSDYNAGMLPAIEDPRLQPEEKYRKMMQEQAAKHQKEIDELHARLRQEETPSRRRAQSQERLMDEKSDVKTLPKKAARKPNKSGTAKVL